MNVIFDDSCAPALSRFLDFLGLDVEEQRVMGPGGFFGPQLHVTAKPEVDFKALAARLAAAQSTQSVPTVSGFTEITESRDNLVEAYWGAIRNGDLMPLLREVHIDLEKQGRFYGRDGKLSESRSRMRSDLRSKHEPTT